MHTVNEWGEDVIAPIMHGPAAGTGDNGSNTVH